MLAAMTTAGFEFARDVAHEQDTDLGIVLLGDKATNPPSVIVLDLPPGHVLERHARNTHRFEFVVKGSIITVGGRELQVGDVTTSAPGEFHGPLTDGREGCLTVEIFADAGGLVPQKAHDTSPEGSALMASIGERARASLGG